MVKDRVVGVVCLEEVLERSRPLLRGGFNVVDFDRRQVDAWVVSDGFQERR